MESLNDLHQFMEEWHKRYNLNSWEGIALLTQYLSERVTIQVKLEKCKHWELSDEEVKKLNT